METSSIKILGELAEYINYTEDYDVEKVSQIIEKNNWFDMQGTNLGICDDANGEYRLEFNDDAEAVVNVILDRIVIESVWFDLSLEDISQKYDCPEDYFREAIKKSGHDYDEIREAITPINGECSLTDDILNVVYAFDTDLVYVHDGRGYSARYLSM